MSDNRQENRALIRMGARDVREDELNKIAGGAFTHASHVPTGPASNPDVGFDS